MAAVAIDKVWVVDKLLQGDISSHRDSLHSTDVEKHLTTANFSTLMKS